MARKAKVVHTSGESKPLRRPAYTPSVKKDRKRETEPVLDGSANAEPTIRSKELPEQAFRTVIRNIKNRDVIHIDQVRSSFYEVMRDLGVKRDRTKAVKGIPNGGDSLETGSLVRWARSLTKADKKAIQQLVAIHATCMQRVGR